jgi:cellobiose-specific phosphotransferase system component IIA
MTTRFAIDRLPSEQYQFVIDAVNAGCTDREICDAFEKQFDDPLAKSSLGRWRDAAGKELAQQFRLARFQATQLLESLQQTDAQKFDLVMASVDDHLMTALRQITSQDPLKLLAVYQKEGGRRLTKRIVELNEKDLALAAEHDRRRESLQSDRLLIGTETWRFILDWLKDREPQVIDVLLKRSEELVKGLGTFLQKRFPA